MITEQSLDQFKIIYEQDYGKKLESHEVLAVATKVLNFIRLATED